MPKFVDDLHVAGALQASADPAKVTNTLQKAVGQSVDIEQYLDTDGTTVKGKVDASFIATFQALIAAGLTGATSAARYVGATTSGAPVSGTFVTGDWVISKADAKVYACTAGGTPGTWTSQSGGGIANALPGQSGYLTGYWYGALRSTMGTASNGNGLAVYTPFFLSAQMVADRIGIEVTTGGSTGSTLRLGVYNASASGTPGTVLFDAGTVAATSTGVQAITISQTIPAGLYWFACACQNASAGAPTIRTATTLYPQADPNGSTAGSNVPSGFYTVSGVTGAFGNNPTISGIGTGGAAHVQLRST